MKRVALVVDDDAKNVRLARDLLQAKGWDTLEAGNGQEAVDLAKEHLPQLILMDIMMPVMNGIDAIRILKSDRNCADIPIMAVTSKAMPQEQREIMDAGCDDYLSKPIDVHAFLGKVDELCGKGECGDEG